LKIIIDQNYYILWSNANPQTASKEAFDGKIKRNGENKLKLNY